MKKNGFKGLLLIMTMMMTAMTACEEMSQDNPVVPDDPEVVAKGLPVVEITTPAPVTSKEKWVDGVSMRIVVDSQQVAAYDLSMKGRGNVSWYEHPKKAYALKLTEKAEVLGMAKHKRWALLNNYLDRTLLRNDVAFEIARRTSLAWTPDCRHVELYLNGKHLGSYLLVEQIKVSSNRVDISDDGCLMEVDTYYDEVNKFKSPHGLPYMFKEPDEDKLTESQFNGMRDFISRLEASLWDDDLLAAHDYEKYIDVQSFIDYWLVQELTLNLECNHPKSTYCYREADGLLTMGPAWDFDCKTFCNEFFQDSWDEDRTKPRTEQYCIANALYYGRLFKDPKFMAAVRERWKALRSGFYDIPFYIEQQRDLVRPSDAANHALWPIPLYMGDELLSFDEAVNRLKDFYIKKLQWLNKQLD